MVLASFALFASLWAYLVHANDFVSSAAEAPASVLAKQITMPQQDERLQSSAAHIGLFV
jgi:hypothetical protein